MLTPPIFELRSMNWSGVIVPPFSALSPYWMPVLSYAAFAKPPAIFSGAVHSLSGRLPSAPIMKSCSVPRQPFGLFCGSYI